MSKAYVDTPDTDKSNASLLYIPENGDVIYNFFSTKFAGRLRGIWDTSYLENSPSMSKFIVWFSDYYSYEDLINDLSFFEFSVVKVSPTFDMFDEMVFYVEANNL